MSKRSPEEIKAYYAMVRERWQAAKKLSESSEWKATYMLHGNGGSITGYIYCAVQMSACGYDGIPYVDCMTFKKWQASGFAVRKGEKSKIDGVTWLQVEGKESDSEGFMFPKTYHLFHRSQVEPIAVEARELIGGVA